MHKPKQVEPYAQVPKSILYNKNLTLTQVGVFIHMYDKYRYHHGKGEDYFESLEKIAESLRISRTVVQQSIKMLEGEGFVIKSKRTKGKFSSNLYTVLAEAPRKKTFVEEHEDEFDPFHPS